MMKKPIYMALAVVFALVLLAACGGDFTEMDIGLDGNWISQSGEQLLINGMGFTRTTKAGVVDTGTIGAAGNKITFSRIGRSPETKVYALNFPQLQIGDITYYYDSPSEPVDIEGLWFAWSGYSPALLFFPGQRIKDENKRDTPAKEGDFIWYGYFKGRYMVSNRNLPNTSVLVLTTTHIHVKNIWAFIYADGMSLDLMELFDTDILVPPSTIEGLDDWWFTIEEVHNYFEAAADQTKDLAKKSEVYDLLDYFLYDYKIEGTYSYSTEVDLDITNTLNVVMDGTPNRLTLTEEGHNPDRFFKSTLKVADIWNP
jgi:hypothetical protein